MKWTLKAPSVCVEQKWAFKQQLVVITPLRCGRAEVELWPSLVGNFCKRSECFGRQWRPSFQLYVQQRKETMLFYVVNLDILPKPAAPGLGLSPPSALSILFNSFSTSNFIAPCPLRPPLSPCRCDKHTAPRLQTISCVRPDAFCSISMSFCRCCCWFSFQISFLQINEICFWIRRKWLQSYLQPVIGRESHQLIALDFGSRHVHD